MEVLLNVIAVPYRIPLFMGRPFTPAAAPPVTGGVFDPADYGGGTLFAWYKADAITDYADTDAVSGWVDSSGNGRVPTQTGSTAKPLYRTNQVNGLPALDFDGNDCLFLSDTTFAGSDQPFTVITVALPQAVSSATRNVFGLGSSSSNTPITECGITTGWRLNRRDDSNATKTLLQGTPVVDTWYVLTYRFTGTEAEVWVNGVSQGTAVDLDVDVLTTDRIGIGALQRAAIINGWNGLMAELIPYTSALSDSDRGAIETALGEKYAISVS